MATDDAMPIRLHLRGLRVLEVTKDLPEELVVSVMTVRSSLHCSACGFKTT